MRTPDQTRLRTAATVVAAMFFNAIVLTSSAATAAEGRTITCFVFPKNAKQPQAAIVLSSIVRGQMGQLEGVTLRTGAPPGNAQATVEAQRLTDEGFKSLAADDKDGAYSRFKSASDVLAQNPGAGDTRLHARVAKGLGIAIQMTGKPATEARDAVKRSLILYPKQAATEYAYSVESRNLFEQARREISDMASGRVEVKSTPDAAEVYLDGTFRGYTPITLQNAAAGSHLVEVVKDGFLRWSTSASVPEGGRAPVEALLTASPAKAEVDKAIAAFDKGVDQKRFATSAPALLRAVDAKEALVLTATAGPKGYELSGFYRDLAGTVKPVNGVIAQDADFLKNIRKLLSDAMQVAFAAEGKAEPLDGPSKDRIESVMKESSTGDTEVTINPDDPIFKDPGVTGDSDSIVKKWWFWTIIGTVTAGAIVGIAVGVTRKTDTASGNVGNLTFTLDQVGGP